MSIIDRLIDSLTKVDDEQEKESDARLLLLSSTEMKHIIMSLHETRDRKKNRHWTSGARNSVPYPHF